MDCLQWIFLVFLFVVIHSLAMNVMFWVFWFDRELWLKCNRIDLLLGVDIVTHSCGSLPSAVFVWVDNSRLVILILNCDYFCPVKFYCMYFVGKNNFVVHCYELFLGEFCIWFFLNVFREIYGVWLISSFVFLIRKFLINKFHWLNKRKNVIVDIF